MRAALSAVAALLACALPISAQVCTSASPDETAPIQAAINAGSPINFEPRLYCVNARQGVRIPSDRILKGNGATIGILPGCATNCKAFETIPGSSRVRLENMTVVGDLSPAVGFSIGIRADSVSGFELESVTLRDWRTDAIWQGGNLGTHDSRLSKITVDGFGRNGLSIVNGSDFVVERYSCKRAVQIVAGTPANPGACIDIEPNSGDRVTDAVIIDSMADDAEIGFYLHAGHGFQNIGVSLINSESRNGKRYGIVLNSTLNGYILGNRVFAPPPMPGKPIPVGISVGGTFIPGTPGILAENITIAGNHVEGTTRYGILAGVKNIYLIGNDGAFLPVQPVAGTPATQGIQVTVP